MQDEVSSADSVTNGRPIHNRNLKMIGYMNVNKRPMAVLQVEDKVKQVKVGDYIGLDFGMVTQISDTEVQLRELIQDSAGDWTERKSSLYLQSKEGSKK